MAKTPRQTTTVDSSKPEEAAGNRNVPVDVKAILAAQAERFKGRIQATGGDMIRPLKKKKFKMPDGTEREGPLRVVVLDFVSFNAWYDRGYVEGEAVPPACFAIGPDPEELVPSEKSPVRQADSCAECAFNEWGSKGKGKMCGNHRVLAVVEDSDDPKAPIMTLKVSPTGIRYWDAHVADCFAANPAGPIAAVTEIYFDEDSDYPSLRFCSPEPSVNENVALHVTRQSVAADKLAREPDVSQYEPPKPVARGTSRKK